MERLRNVIPLIVLAAAGILKFIVWIDNRSLFLDEQNLSRALLEVSYTQLIGALHYGQFAPPLFSMLVKLCTDLFGVWEYNLRLLPFFAGLGSLYFFYHLAKRYITSFPALIFTLILFAFSEYFLRYNTEIKQYSTDAFMALSFIWMTLNMQGEGLKRILLLGLGGAIGLWISMPLVFIMLGAAAYLLLTDPRSRGDLAGIFALWVLSFVVLYYLVFRHGISSAHLQQFHATYFLEFPTSMEKATQSINILTDIMGSMVGHTTLPILFGLLCILIGAYRLFKLNKAEAALLILPVLACILASMLHFYSLLIRLTLFFLPLLMILIGIGAAYLYSLGLKLKMWRVIIRLISVGLMLLCLSYHSAFPYFVKTYEVQHARPILKMLSEHPLRELPIYVTFYGTPSYDFYGEFYADPIKIPSEKIMFGHWSDNLAVLGQDWKTQGITQMWIYDSHTYGKQAQKLHAGINAMGEIVESIPGLWTIAYRVQLK